MEAWSRIHQWGGWTTLRFILLAILHHIYACKRFLRRMSPCSRAHMPAQSLPLKPVEDYRAGYPRLCTLMEAHGGFMICRRFARVRARLLLLKQDRICQLEEQLDKIDQDEPSPLFLGVSRADRNVERLSILTQIDTSLADYDSYLERSNRVSNYVPAPRRDSLSLMNWLHGNRCINGLETAYLEYEKDLISLSGPADRATSKLENWIEDILIEYYPGFRTLPSHSASTDSNVYIYSGRMIKRTAAVLLLLLITILLLLPVIICTTITSMLIRLFVVVLSTAVYLTILSSLTRAKTIELILAGATFITILVVFVSNTGSTDH